MFSHLHSHTEYSELDGMTTISAMAERVKALGQNSAAITDHGNLYGAIEFYKTFKANDLHPVLGLETYVAHGGMDSGGLEDAYGNHTYHLCLLAENNKGWENLIKLSTTAHLDGFWRKPRIDRELLAKHSEGLIVLSGCPSSELQRALQNNDTDAATEVMTWYKDVFGDRYYAELQRHPTLPEFTPFYDVTIGMANAADIPIVATQDFHYCNPEDADAHDLLLCIGTNAKKSDEKRFKFSGPDYYITSEQEMLGHFSDVPEAVSNTQLVAERCNVTLEFGRVQLPQPDIPEGMTAIDHLRDLATKGLYQRIPNASQEHVDRLNYEMHVIEETGFAEYFLIVMDFSQFARERNIARAVRGSAAASLVLYSTGITDIDPLEYNLVFERFLNLERREMPDIDMDFADKRRAEVIQYVAQKYGRDHVAQIITFQRLGAKNSIRDAGRALSVSLPEVDKLAQAVPDVINISVEDAISQSADLKLAETNDAAAQSILSYARQIDKNVRGTSTHAAGVVISNTPLIDSVPMRRPVNKTKDDWIPMTQWGMKEVADVGLLKMDFLGLRNLTILERAVEIIKEQTGDVIDYMNIPDGDKKTYDMLTAGDTFGVFQLESGGMRRVTIEMEPKEISDIAAMISLFRPGPIEHIPRYIKSKNGQMEVLYPHDDLKEILDETYGVIVYQDQVLHVARKFAGYTLGQADIMRKAMGKKIVKVMQDERNTFIKGATDQGYTERDAIKIFELIEPFAGYAFNKAHAVSFAIIAYQTAWLKANYPVPYMAAVLSAAVGKSDRLRETTAYCYTAGIPILPPHINHSQGEFSLERADGKEAIRFGLAAIKNVSPTSIEKLIDERERNGEYHSISNFVNRLNTSAIQSRAMQALAKAGAFDDLAPRGAMVDSVDTIMQKARQLNKQRSSGQYSMFDTVEDDDTPMLVSNREATQDEHLSWERDLLGVYITEHPVQKAMDDLAQYDDFAIDTQIANIDEDMIGSKCIIMGVVNTVKERNSNHGTFAIATIEDLSGTKELALWAERWVDASTIVQPGNIILAYTYVRSRKDEISLVADMVELWQEGKKPALHLQDDGKSAIRIIVEEPDDEEASAELMQQLEEVLRGMRETHAGQGGVHIRIKHGREWEDWTCDESWNLIANSLVAETINRAMNGAVKIVVLKM